jgi:hypothetical protein
MAANLTINFVTRRGDGAIVLTLVEQGPWEPAAVAAELERVEQRLYDCLDVVLTGQFAARHPDAKGKPTVIVLDGFDLPDEPVRAFAKRFVEHIANWEELREALRTSEFTHSVDFAFQISNDA